MKCFVRMQTTGWSINRILFAKGTVMRFFKTFIKLDVKVKKGGRQISVRAVYEIMYYAFVKNEREILFSVFRSGSRKTWSLRVTYSAKIKIQYDLLFSTCDGRCHLNAMYTKTRRRESVCTRTIMYKVVSFAIRTCIVHQWVKLYTAQWAFWTLKLFWLLLYSCYAFCLSAHLIPTRQK